MNCPFPKAITSGMWASAYDILRDLRGECGLDRTVGQSVNEMTGAKAVMQISDAQVSDLAEAMALSAVEIGTGMTIHIGSNDGITCPKTDERLAWKDHSLLAPVIGAWNYPEPGVKVRPNFTDLTAFTAIMPLRHVQMTLPSGILLAADWFRIPGFTEGVQGGISDDMHGASINSDKGVDERTRDHFERLGLMRIHTTNCVPKFVCDGDAFRVGWFNEDHDMLWSKDGVATRDMPEIAGSVCCDLWDVTFTDREILIDILVDGGAKISQNAGNDEHGRPVLGCPTDREEAAALLDAYVVEHDVAKLEFAPGTTLHVYMASGHGSTSFHKMFKCHELSDWPFMEEMFVISPVPLSSDPDMVDEPAWKWHDQRCNNVMTISHL